MPLHNHPTDADGNKPWTKLRLSRRAYEAARPWARSGLSRRRWEEVMLTLSDEAIEALYREGEAERLVKALFGEGNHAS